MAFSDLKSFGNSGFIIWVAVITAACALLIQIGTNLANDYFDFLKGTDNEKRVGPLRAIHAGLVSKKEMLASFIITFGLAAALGIILVIRGGWPVLVTGAAAIACGILYTAGPKPIGYIFCIIAAFLIPVIIVLVSGKHYLSLICLAAIFFEIKPLSILVSKPSPPPSSSLIGVLVLTGRALLVFSLLFSAGWIASAYV